MTNKATEDEEDWVPSTTPPTSNGWYQLGIPDGFGNILTNKYHYVEWDGDKFCQRFISPVGVDINAKDIYYRKSNLGVSND